jgi:hypothetical protein
VVFLSGRGWQDGGLIGEGDDLNWLRYLAGSLLGEISEVDDRNWHKYLAGSLLGKIDEGDDLNWYRYLAGSLLGLLGASWTRLARENLNWHKYLAGILLDKIGKGGWHRNPTVKRFLPTSYPSTVIL